MMRKSAEDVSVVHTMPTRRVDKGRKAQSKTPGKGARRGRAKRSAETAPRSRAENPPATSAAQDEGSDLTFQQLRFIDELLADPEMNATAAARKAYPNAAETTVRSIGSENLTKPNIRAEIQRRMTPSLVRARMTKDRVLQLIGDGMNWDIADAFNADGSLKQIHEMPPAVRRQIAGIEVAEIKLAQDGPVVGHIKKVKLYDRTRHIELAARHHKLLTDKFEINDKTGLGERLKRARGRQAS